MRVLFVSAFGLWKRPISFIKSQSDSLRKKGIDIADFYFYSRGLTGYLKSYAMLKRYLKKADKFDIIHAHFGYTALIVYLTFARSKLVISFMGDDLYGKLNNHSKQSIRGIFNIQLSKFLQAKADWIIVKSNEMLNYIEPAFRYKTSVILNGVDFEKFPIVESKIARENLQLEQNKKYVLFLADPAEKRKNIQLLQKAFTLLNDNNVVLINPFPIIGENVYLYLNACDVVVLASFLEGSPNLIKEALVCNCPIVSTDVGDVKERIKNIEGCYLTTYDPENLMIQINNALKFNKRTAGRIQSDYLNSEIVASKIIGIYSSILN